MTTPSGSARLGDFLKARRAQLTPREVGLPEGGTRRKVAGLRRTEVAQLAAISVEYYTRLEQGRVQASATVLATLATALRLDEDQQSYLYDLAGKADARPRRRRTAQHARPAIHRLLDRLTDTPALVLGKRLDVLAWNTAATALYVDFARLPPARRNYVHLMFTEPAFRTLHPHWHQDARVAVSALRREAAADPDDPDLARLVGELSVRDSDFRTWWAEHRVTSAGFGTKTYRHPLVGDLTLDCDTWLSPDGSGQRLMVLTADPGTPSRDALDILLSWQADPSAVQR
ncbi:helix-turn-helix domain-containing protein [Amycolatopsis rhabdoformis]|uniref:Helix-turn-helix domain-containing protein n=1 Tax=Amycolatopsis rhabdoformis TaxID=1448059 RepID=A0ABZ1IFP9_9PSEU|nr:helix-turn-helix domain-containing protein [Amycolatopsis rhabdoformis]WSE33260.1 helix-turn-helix domain-containing protein [Amycolatopsis rhabdoformis]